MHITYIMALLLCLQQPELKLNLRLVFKLPMCLPTAKQKTH